MQTVGQLDCVVRVNVNSFLLRGWCSDCQPESCLKIKSLHNDEVVIRLNSQHERIARPDVIASIGCDQSLLHCGFLVEVSLPEEFTPSSVHFDERSIPWPVPDESEHALRQSLLSLCEASFWEPQVLGSSSASIGLEEALEEIARVCQRGLVALAEELVRCCHEHGFNHPMLDEKLGDLTQPTGRLDCVVRVSVNSFLLKGWCSDCRPESCLKIKSLNNDEVVIRLNSQHERIARPDVIASIGCDQSLLHCGFLVEVSLPEEFTPSSVHFDERSIPWPVPDESEHALRQSLLSLCEASFWEPQVLGSSSASIGLEEALEEIARVRQRESYVLAEELVRCCREHGFSHPILDDNQALIAYEVCDFKRAEAIWRSLASSKHEETSGPAKAKLWQLFESPSVHVQLSNIARLRARESPEFVWRQRLLHVWLQARDAKDQDFVFKVLKDIALDLGFGPADVCDPELMAMMLLSSLCDESLQFWEAKAE